MILSTRQQGMSLIEVMIAMVIGSVLTLGVIQMFISSKQSYRLQESMNHLQESARFGLQVLDYSVRMADHWGGLKGADITGSPAATGLGSCDSTWIFNAEEGVRGYDGTGATPPLPSGCIANADYIPQSDIMVIRYATPTITTNADLGTASVNDVFVRTSVGGSASFVNGGDASISGLADEDGLYNYPYAIEAYFLRPCSNKAASTCAATDDDGLPIPTLTRLSLVNGVLTQHALIEGVEQMQFEYGLDTGTDNTADIYATAATIDGDSALKWEDVISVRISIIVRGKRRDIHNDDTKTYNMVGGFDYIPATADNDYYRRLYTHVIQIRNRSRG